MGGWNLKKGDLVKESTSDELWEAFNYFFSTNSKKTNSYKYALLKSIFDNIFNSQKNDGYYYINFDMIFEKFTINYWNLINKYHLSQIIKNSNNSKSMIEQIFEESLADLPASEISYEMLEDNTKSKLLAEVKKECSRYVVGALYEDLQGRVYGFSKRDKLIWLSEKSYDFVVEYKMELEKLNYYEWAKFLEAVNDDDALVRILSKLESATPKRSNLSVYRDLLFYEFHQNTCFYCGKKLNICNGEIHVDHFIPWVYVKSDNLWNLVLSCDKCNQKKNSKLPTEKSLKKIVYRNDELMKINNEDINETIENYNEQLLRKIYYSAKKSGFTIDVKF